MYNIYHILYTFDDFRKKGDKRRRPFNKNVVHARGKKSIHTRIRIDYT